MGESNENRSAAMQQQGNFEVQIEQLQLEKQNLENLIQQMRAQQSILFDLLLFIYFYPSYS
jgi:hypothetical protein